MRRGRRGCWEVLRCVHERNISVWVRGSRETKAMPLPRFGKVNIRLYVRKTDPSPSQ